VAAVLAAVVADHTAVAEIMLVDRAEVLMALAAMHLVLGQRVAAVVGGAHQEDQALAPAVLAAEKPSI
jgi:hypothetical protein